MKVTFCNCNLRVFKNSQVRAFLLYNHRFLEFNRSLVDFLEIAGQFIGRIWQHVTEMKYGIVATGTRQIQEFRISFSERRLVWGYVSVVHSFQHGVLSFLQNITILSAEGHLISAGLNILRRSGVDSELQLSSGWNRYWVMANWICVDETVSASSVMYVKALLPCSEGPNGGSLLVLMIEVYMIGKLYSLEYVDVPKVFLTPHHEGYCSSNLIWCQCWAVNCSSLSLGHCCTNMI
jgi:hypothetical protein